MSGWPAHLAAVHGSTSLKELSPGRDWTRVYLCDWKEKGLPLYFDENRIIERQNIDSIHNNLLLPTSGALDSPQVSLMRHLSWKNFIDLSETSFSLYKYTFTGQLRPEDFYNS